MSDTDVILGPHRQGTWLVQRFYLGDRERQERSGWEPCLTEAGQVKTLWGPTGEQLYMRKRAEP